MKNLDKFLNEEEVDKSKPHKVTREDEYPDDKLYFALMDQYKMMRRQDRRAAGKILDKAQKLKNVSQKAKIGAAYL